MNGTCPLFIPFAELVTKKLLANARMNGFEVFYLGTLDWGRILVMLPWWMWRKIWTMS